MLLKADSSTYAGLPWHFRTWLIFITWLSWVSGADIRAWAALSAFLWIMSGLSAITSDSEVPAFHSSVLSMLRVPINSPFQNLSTWAFFSQIVGVLAALVSVLAINELWSLVKTRHRFIHGIADPGVRKGLMQRLGIEVIEGPITNTIAFDADRLVDLARREYDLHFVRSDAQLRWFSAVNVLYYVGSIFGGSFKKKLQRNAAFRARNPLAQLLIRRDPAEQFWGITSVLPMNNRSWLAYVQDGVSDNDFPSEWISRYPDSGGLHFDVLLLFSIGSMRNGRLIVDQGRLEEPEVQMDMMFVGSLYQIVWMLGTAGKRSVERVYVAADDERLATGLRAIGFRNTNRRTAEGIPILRVAVRLVRS